MLSYEATDASDAGEDEVSSDEEEEEEEEEEDEGAAEGMNSLHCLPFRQDSI